MIIQVLIKMNGNHKITVHVCYARLQKHAKTEKEIKCIQSMHGARYTSL